MGPMSLSTSSTDMVGRAEELGELRSALATAADGQPTMLLLGGEAGVGKTRLVSEFMTEAAASGVRVLVGQCVELGGDGLAFAPVADALREMAAQLGAEAVLELAGPGRDALRAVLPELGAGTPDAADGRGRLFEVVTVLLERVSADRPLTLVIEDLHWADGSTRDLLRFCVRALGSARVLVVGTFRSDEVHRSHPLRPFLAELDRIRSVRRVDLPRLSRPEVGDQLEGILGGPAGADAVARVYERSEGIPFFVEELAGVQTGERHAPLPASLRDLLLVRAERLADTTQQVLRLLAVGGDRVDHALLAAVDDDGADGLESALREAVSANVLRVDGEGYAFRHALLREAIQDDLLPGERIRLHARYAARLEECPGLLAADAAATAIAHHWYAAHDQQRAFCACLRAGDDAVRAYAHGEALLMFERALELWTRMPDPVALSGGDHAGLLSRAATAASDAGELERALALLEAAVAETGVVSNSSRLAGLLVDKAKLLGDLGRAESTTVTMQALEIVPAEPPSLPRARLLQMLAARRMMDWDFAAAVGVAEEAAAVAIAVGATDVEFRVYTILGPSLVQTGRIDEGLRALQTAAELAGGSPRLLAGSPINTSDTLNLLGRYSEAAQVATDGIERAREVGLARTIGAMMVGNAAEPLLALGDWERAEVLIERGLELEPPLRHVWHLLRLQAWLRLWRGDVVGARRSMAKNRALMAAGSPGPQYTLPSAMVAAELALAHGDPAVGWREVAGAIESTRPAPGHDLPLLAVGARALAARARLAEPDAEWFRDAARIREALDTIGDWGPASMWRGVVEAELAGTVGDEPEPWRVVREAVGLPAHLCAYARYRLAMALAAAGQRGAAAGALQEAAERADHLGAGLIRGWIDDLGRRAGIRLPDQRADPSSDDREHVGLTVREREVLRLVAAGRSNRQIGEELFISAKTVSVHVSNILTKLGVSARGEAAAFAHRQGLFSDAHLV